MQNFRDFASGPDPFGRMWQVQLKWLQTAISIRHSDTIDVKFILRSDGEVSQKTIALPHLALRQAAERLKVTMSDAWCARIAVAHLQFLIESGDDMDKDLVTLDAAQINGYADDLSRAEPAARRAAI